MGLVLMSERELQRIEVLVQDLDGSQRSATAAQVLELSRRQIQRPFGKQRRRYSLTGKRRQYRKSWL